MLFGPVASLVSFRIGTRVYRRRWWLNLVPIASAVDVGDGRVMTARWYALTWLGLSLDLTVACAPRPLKPAWSFPDRLLRRL